MRRLFISLSFLTISLTACTEASPYTIDEKATVNASWKVNDVISQDMCLGDAYNAIESCDRQFLGITTQRLVLVQNFHSSGAKATDPYLINDAHKLPSDPDFKIYGTLISWYKNGQKAIETHFQEGQPQGLSLEWFETGQKRSEGRFENGQEQGSWIIWHKNGQKQEEGQYQNGRHQGLWTYWYNHGQKAMEGHYLNDQRQGVWRYWDKNGQRIK